MHGVAHVFEYIVCMASATLTVCVWWRVGRPYHGLPDLQHMMLMSAGEWSGAQALAGPACKHIAHRQAHAPCMLTPSCSLLPTCPGSSTPMETITSPRHSRTRLAPAKQVSWLLLLRGAMQG
jgi:hypothetical protein